MITSDIDDDVSDDGVENDDEHKHNEDEDDDHIRIMSRIMLVTVVRNELNKQEYDE